MRPRILVVDDEPFIGLLYQEEFEEEGYEVKVVSRGGTVLAVLDGFEPDLVTLDIKMPDVNGIEMLRVLKERRGNLPVILCTGYDKYTADVGSWPCDAYVVKSSNLDGLKSTVRRLLQPAAA